MSDTRPILTPIDPYTILQSGAPEQIFPNISTYQSIIDLLMYTVTRTRPDLAYPVTYLSQYLSCPTADHQSAAKRVLKYLWKTSK